MCYYTTTYIYCFLVVIFSVGLAQAYKVEVGDGPVESVVGQNVVLECSYIKESGDNDDLPQVSWYKGEIVDEVDANRILTLPRNSDATYYPNEDTFNSPKFTSTRTNVNADTYAVDLGISRVQTTDSDDYKCYITPLDQGTIVLDVQEASPPTSVAVAGTSPVLEGDSTTLTCTSDGRPSPTCTWTHQDTDLPTPIPDSCQLGLTNLQRDDGRTYTCNATNSEGSGDSTFELDVRFSATIINPENNTTFANKGGEAVLKCEAEGNPPPDTFTWTKDNTAITGSKDHTDLEVSSPVGYASSSTLTIDPVDAGRDYGDYICNASNPHGYDILIINLEVKSIPEPAAGLSVTSATGTELTVTWVEGHDGGYPQTFTVEYRVYGSGPEWKVSQTVDNPPLILTDLQPTTQYEIRVRSENMLGSIHRQSEAILANTAARPTNTPGASTADIPIKAGPTTDCMSLIIGVVVGLVVLFGSILLSVVIVLCKRYNVVGNDNVQCIACKKQMNTYVEPQYARPDYKHTETVYTDLKTVNIVTEEGGSPIYSDFEKRNWEFARDRLALKERVGSGAFGQVWRAEARNIAGNKGRTIVAVKTLKDQTTDQARKDLLSELEFMKLLSAHPNVVSLLGCCTQRPGARDPIYVIVEFVPFGNLQKFLRDHRSQSSSVYDNIHKGSKDLTPRDLISFAYDTAKGMAYLSSMQCIHRDLAARNVLVGENKICKVTDFGFSRDVLNTGEYEKKTQGRLPIRWMALESLVDSVYTLKSDVWSFGVLLWEIVTMGSSPYPGMSAAQVIEHLQNGYRMPKPQNCSQQIYNLMMECWNENEEQRISFSLLIKELENLIENGEDYVDIVALDEKIYYSLEKYSISGEII